MFIINISTRKDAVVFLEIGNPGILLLARVPIAVVLVVVPVLELPVLHIPGVGCDLSKY
jgi:hypothetical protein